MPPPRLRNSTNKANVPIYQPPKPRQKPCVINRLPDEVLREIFTLVFDYPNVPVFLFLVSRRWNEVASGLSLLRSVLHFAGQRDREDLWINEYQKPVFCTTPDQFSRALARIVNAEYELFLWKMPANFDLETHSMSTRCRMLSIDFGPDAEVTPISLPSMGALQKFSISLWLPNFEGSLDKVGHLFERIESGSPLLTNLIIEGLFPKSLFQRHVLLERLTEVELAMFSDALTLAEVTILCSRLPNVERFTWENLSAETDAFVMAPVSTKFLSFRDILEVPNQNYKNVVTLVVNYVCSGSLYVSSSKLLHFPALQKLWMYGSWYGLPLIRAPILQRLVLGNTDQSEEEIKEWLSLIQLKPKVIYLNKQMSDANLIQLLIGIWWEVEELHKTYFLSSDVPGVLLAQALTGSATTPPLCPDMWCFTMRIRSSEAPDPILARRSVQRLRQTVKGRRRNGCTSLTRVRCGWIDESQNGNSNDDDAVENPEDPPSDWVDVL